MNAEAQIKELKAAVRTIGTGVFATQLKMWLIYK